MEKRLWFFLLMWITMTSACGCKFVKIQEEEKTPVEYEILNEDRIPEEIALLIEGKKTREFQMTYQRQNQLYLIKGYGQQMTGGYGIQVTELGMNQTALFLKTRLLAPQEADVVDLPSCPYIVIKTRYRKLPVIFQ